MLDSAIAIGNGFGGSANRVTYNKISGSANFATWQYGYASDEVKGYVTVNTLDEYHGSIQVRGGSQLTIGTVNVSGSTDLTGCIVPVSCTTPFNNLIVGSVNGYPSLSVDGSDTGKNLVYATKNATTGLYLAVAEVNGVKYATLAEAAANAGASSSITKLADTAEAVPAGWKLNGSGTAYVKMHSVRFTVY